MSFLSGLFGGGSTPTPTPTPAAPTISSGVVEAADREEAARLKNRTGVDKTLLTGGLGDVGSNQGGQANVAHTTLLGGGSQ